MIGGFWAPGSVNCFSSLCCGKVAFKSHIQVLLLKLLFSLSTAGDLSPTWGPQALLPFWISGGCPWQSLAGGPARSLSCMFCLVREGAHSAFPNCRHGLSSAALLELMFGVWFLRTDTEGRVVSYLDWGCLDTPPLVGILPSLCWALARQLVWVAWLFLTFQRPLLWQKWWSGQGRFSPSLLAEEKAALLDWSELWEQ